MPSLEGGGGTSPPFRILDRLRLRQRPEGRVARGYRAWMANESPAPSVPHGPRISVLMPIYNTPSAFLKAAVSSVRKQTYENWELCIVDDASPSPSMGLLLADTVAGDHRIRHIRLERNEGIAGATNAAFAMAKGEYVALLDHDDELPPQALARVAAELVNFPALDLVFSDEDKLVDGHRRGPYFKPGWNPDLLLSQNMVSHFGVYRRELVHGLGGMRPEFTGSQDYDLALRATALLPRNRIRHIPEVLYHWRQHEESFSARRAQQCEAAARAALAAHLGPGTIVEPNPEFPQWPRIRYPIPDPAPLVSLILPPGVEPPAQAGYDKVEICLGDLGAATGNVLVFLGKGMAPARPGWLRELVSHAIRPGIGCAGPRLDRPDGRIAHSGYLLDPTAIAQTLSPPSDSRDPGYAGHFVVCRTVAAVAQMGMAVRRDIYNELGGFDLRAGAYADVDFCLRLADMGLRCVWTPHARLRYRVLPRRRNDDRGARYMLHRWSERLAADPYLNPNLCVRDGNLNLVGRRAVPLPRKSLIL